jgi:hypothetical protein
MGRILALAAVLAAVAAPAQAQDSVTGVALTGEGRAFVEFTFDAHSGPSGESPTGTVWFNALLADFGRLPVTCLAVSGNRAGIVLEFPGATPPIPAGVVMAVEDNGAGPDGVNWTFVDDLPTTCPPPAGPVIGPIVSGDVVVTDAHPSPISKDQCKNGGWRTYGVFKNQGDCVRFVRRGTRRACIFERVAHGIPAFQAKYGIGPRRQLAMWSCVHRRIGV